MRMEPKKKIGLFRPQIPLDTNSPFDFSKSIKRFSACSDGIVEVAIILDKLKDCYPLDQELEDTVSRIHSLIGISRIANEEYKSKMEKAIAEIINIYEEIELLTEEKSRLERTVKYFNDKKAAKKRKPVEQTKM